MIGISIHPMLHFIPRKYELSFCKILISYHINWYFAMFFQQFFSEV